MAKFNSDNDRPGRSSRSGDSSKGPKKDSARGNSERSGKAGDRKFSEKRPRISEGPRRNEGSERKFSNTRNEKPGTFSRGKSEGFKGNNTKERYEKKEGGERSFGSGKNIKTGFSARGKSEGFRGNSDKKSHFHKKEEEASPYKKRVPKTEGFDRKFGINNDRTKPLPPERGRKSGQGEEDINTPNYDFKTAKENYSKHHAPKAKTTDTEKRDGIRLNRYISNSGVCSRRDADLLIETGEITINGKVVTEMGYMVQANDVVKYNGRTLKREKLVYVLLNKPKDFITTTNDPDERKTVMDLVANAATERLYPVGRLDRNTTGLLLLTNDGELSEKLAHPSNNIKKIYHVDLDKPLEEEDFEKIVAGVKLFDGVAQVDDLAIVGVDRTSIGIEIHLGRNRIVRRIFEELGYKVERLDRIMYAGLTKKDIPRGNWRYLTEKELVRLKFQK